MASNVGQGPPAGEPQPPIDMKGASPGSAGEDKGGFRSNLETMRESINVVGKLNAALSTFTSKIGNQGKQQVTAYAVEVKKLNEELRETARLMQETGQGGGTGGVGGGLLVPSGGGSYTQRQLPRAPSVEQTVTRGGGGAEVPPGGTGAPPAQPGPGGRAGWARTLGVGALASSPFAAASWFERQRGPVSVADMQFNRLAMAGGRSAESYNAAMLRSFDQNRFTGHEEFFGTQASLEARGVVAGGRDFERFMGESGAMRNFVPHRSAEEIAGAAATLAHGQAGHSLRMRGIIDRNASTEEQFRQILTVASAHDRLPTGAELRHANPGTAMYAVLMNLTGGDAELVRMIIDWGIAEDASKRRTGQPISLTDEHAADMGMTDTVEFSERSRQAAAAGNIAERQEEMATAIMRQHRVAEWTTGKWREMGESMGVFGTALIESAGFLSTGAQHFSGLMGMLGPVLAGWLAGGGAQKAGGLFRGGAGGGGRVVGAMRGGIGGAAGKVLAPVGLAFSARDFADSVGQVGAAFSGEARERDENWASRFWDRVIPGQGTEPAGGSPMGYVHGADHWGEGISERGFGGVRPHVARAGHFLDQMFGPFPGGIGGVGSRQGKSDHPRGLALDLMTMKDSRLGDRVVNFLAKNWKHFAVKYIIWKQRINSGDGRGWRKMEDRGSITANHFDHPHISFEDAPTSGASGSVGVEPFTEDADDTGAFDLGGETSTGLGTSSGSSTATSGNYFSSEEADILGGMFGGAGSAVSSGGGGSATTPAGMDAEFSGERPQVAGTGTLSDAEIARLAAYGGWRGADVVTATAVALAESRGNPRGIGDTHINPGTGEQSTGLWQIHYRPSRDANNAIRDPQANLDPHRNAKNAFQIYQDQGWGAWSVHPASRGYTPGNSYTNFLDRARAAVSQVSAGVQPAGGLDGMPMSEGTPSGGSTTVGSAAAGLSTGTTRQVNVNMRISIEKASREEAERLAREVRNLIRQEEGIHMVGAR